ncbi:unnamed protein product [Ilex paraguariensis]|uniref:Glycosyltransferase n=1 Tax=Ilex paraguariensis TaxID=185542 RepID=A0ABC8RUQ6_9AQUA
MATVGKPHAVCIPYPAQSHIKAMLKLAKLLHHKGCHVTFVNTEFNHKRFLKSGGPNFLNGLPDFRFESIPDGLPPSDIDVAQDIPSLCLSVRKYCLAPFVDLLSKLSDSTSLNIPRVTSIVSDGFMTFTIDAAEELGVPIIQFWTLSACGFMGFYQLHNLLEKGFTPLKDASYLTNGYLDTVIDWIPGMKGIRLKDIPSFVRTTDQNEPTFNFVMEAAQRCSKASAIIVQTFDALEPELVDALSFMFSHVYTIAPLQLFLNQIAKEDGLNSIGYSLWKEDSKCLQWLNSKETNSVVYVNFGSITVMPLQLLVEFAWGLANSNHYFLWIIRPGLVMGDSAILPPEFMAVTTERGFITSWCPQEQVLNHPSVGGFLTHGGWNSTIEGLSNGVPMICWPFFADQQTNCRYMCTKWNIGMEIDNDVKRDEVEKLVRQLMEGEHGKRMKNEALEWKRLAEKATSLDGSSSLNLDDMISKFVLPRN